MSRSVGKQLMTYSFSLGSWLANWLAIALFTRSFASIYIDLMRARVINMFPSPSGIIDSLDVIATMDGLNKINRLRFARDSREIYRYSFGVWKTDPKNKKKRKQPRKPHRHRIRFCRFHRTDAGRRKLDR